MDRGRYLLFSKQLFQAAKKDRQHPPAQISVCRPGRLQYRGKARMGIAKAGNGIFQTEHTRAQHGDILRSRFSPGLEH